MRFIDKSGEMDTYDKVHRLMQACAEMAAQRDALRTQLREYIAENTQLRATIKEMQHERRRSKINLAISQHAFD